jgi:hypothetical protein
MAGAHAGWFSVWMFTNQTGPLTMGSMRGVQMLVEDLAPAFDKLQTAVEHCFAKQSTDAPVEQPTLVVDTEIEEEVDEIGEIDLDADEKEAERLAAATAELAARKQKMVDGFRYHWQYVYDCARLFSDLPPQSPQPAVLAVRAGANLWVRPRTANPWSAGAALPDAYDFVTRLPTAGMLDLQRYRTIIVQDPGPVRDATISAVDDWLKTTPGLLYIHARISSANTIKDATVADHQTPLVRDWPWEADLRLVTQDAEGRPKLMSQTFDGPAGPVTAAAAESCGHVEITGTHAKALLTRQNRPVLVRWRHPQYKGVVLIDTCEYPDANYIAVVRSVINKSAADGVGIKMTGPLLHETVAAAGGLKGTATTRYHRPLQETPPLSGIELLTGDADPEAGNGRGTLVAPSFAGRHVLVRDGVHVFSAAPFKHVNATGDLELAATGLLRVTTPAGAAITLSDDGVLPVVEPEDAAAWMFTSTAPGVLKLPAADDAPRVTRYVRASSAVHIAVGTGEEP